MASSIQQLNGFPSVYQNGLQNNYSQDEKKIEQNLLTFQLTPIPYTLFLDSVTTPSQTVSGQIPTLPNITPHLPLAPFNLSNLSILSLLAAQTPPLNVNIVPPLSIASQPPVEPIQPIWVQEPEQSLQSAVVKCKKVHKRKNRYHDKNTWPRYNFTVIEGEKFYNNNPDWRCVACKIPGNKTPQLRAGPTGKKTLCNSCGIKWSKIGNAGIHIAQTTLGIPPEKEGKI